MFVRTIKHHTIRLVTVCTLTMLAFPSLLLIPAPASAVVLRGLVDPQALFEAGGQPDAQGQLGATHQVAGERDHMMAVVGLLVLITIAAGAYRLGHRHYPTKQPDMIVDQDRDKDGAQGVAEQANMSLMPSAKDNFLR